MDRWIKPVVSACFVFGLGALQAQTPPPAPTNAPAVPDAQHAHPAQEGRGDVAHAARHLRHMAQLKQKLNLTPAQEGAWQTWTQALQPPPRSAREAKPHMKAMTTPERLEHMRKHHAERAAKMDQRALATQSFYSALSEAQKKAFDEETARFFMPRHHRMGMMQGHAHP